MELNVQETIQTITEVCRRLNSISVSGIENMRQMTEAYDALAAFQNKVIAIANGSAETAGDQK